MTRNEETKKEPRAMKFKVLIAITLLAVSIPLIIKAGTLENADSDSYKYQIKIGDKYFDGHIDDRSTLYGICDYGCTLILVESGQSVYMKPDDYVIIEEGVLKVMHFFYFQQQRPIFWNMKGFI